MALRFLQVTIAEHICAENVGHENMDLKESFVNLLRHDFFYTKSIKENQFEKMEYLFDLHKLDGVLKMRQKRTKAMLPS